MSVPSPGPMLLTGYKSEVLLTPSLGWIYWLLIERLTELRKPIYPLDYQFIPNNIKGWKSKARGRDTSSKVLNKGVSTPWSLGSARWPVEEFWSTSLEALWIPSFWVFMEATLHRGFPGGSDGDESACKAGNTGEVGLISSWGRFPGEGNGNSLQYSSVENPIDRRAWLAILHRAVKGWTWLSS